MFIEPIIHKIAEEIAANESFRAADGTSEWKLTESRLPSPENTVFVPEWAEPQNPESELVHIEARTIYTVPLHVGQNIEVPKGSIVTEYEVHAMPVTSSKVAHIDAIDRQVDQPTDRKPVDVQIVTSRIRNPA